MTSTSLAKSFLKTLREGNTGMLIIMDMHAY